MIEIDKTQALNIIPKESLVDVVYESENERIESTTARDHLIWLINEAVEVAIDEVGKYPLVLFTTNQTIRSTVYVDKLDQLLKQPHNDVNNKPKTKIINAEETIKKITTMREVLQTFKSTGGDTDVKKAAEQKLIELIDKL